MFIDLVDINGFYRGVQRQQKSLYVSGNKLIKRYNKLLSTERIPFSAKNIEELLDICNSINLYRKEIVCEVIAYSKHEIVINKENILDFLGFDVSGDSCYLSPVKTAFFNYTNQSAFKEIHNLFFPLVNINGLFDKENDAVTFANYLNLYDKGFFENDGKYTQVWVYRVK